MRRGTRRVLFALLAVSLVLTVVSIFLLHDEQQTDDRSHKTMHTESRDGFPDYDDPPRVQIDPKKPVSSTKLNESIMNTVKVEEKSNVTEPKAVAEPIPEKNVDHDHEKYAESKVELNLNSTEQLVAKADAAVTTLPQLNYNLHTFYYPWYGSPQFDATYVHWNHRYLPHWNKREAAKWPTGQHTPPLDIGSDYYPSLGPYSSRDESVISKHMQWLTLAKIGVICVSWYPKGLADEQGKPSDDMIMTILNIADKFAIKVTLHLEPYPERSVSTVRADVEYITKSYGAHNAMFYYQHQGVKKLLLYVYDSYLIKPGDWNQLLTSKGNLTIRGSEYDAFIIGLIVKEGDRMDCVKSGFDGAYTYFASDGFTYGSTGTNWPSLRVFAKKNKLIFIPCVGPGYTDVRVRPWNSMNTKQRNNGTYYSNSFTAAIDSQADLIGITSFNEWHEGTQIEPAVAKITTDGFTYLDYTPNAPEFYLNLTAKWSDKFAMKLEEMYGAKEQKLLIAAAGV